MEVPAAGISPLSQTPEAHLVAQSELLLFHKIENHNDYSALDFYQTLQAFRDAKVKPLEIQQNGMNLLHKCLELRCFTFLPSLVLIGWWNILLHSKVCDTSVSTHRGKTVAEMSQSEPRLSAEVEAMTEWEDSLTPLMRDLRRGHGLKLCKQELSKENINKCDANGGTVLYWVVVAGDGDLFKTFLNLGVDPSIVTRGNMNLLHTACMVGMSHMIPLLLSYNIDPWLMDEDGNRPLEIVLNNEDADAATQFEKCGMTLSTRPVVHQPVLSGRQVTFLEYLVEGCLPLSNLCRSQLEDLRAAQLAKVLVFKHLISHGANLEAVTNTNRNLLHLIAANGNVELLQLVISLYRKHGRLDKMINMRDKYEVDESYLLIPCKNNGRDEWHFVEVFRDRFHMLLEEMKRGLKTKEIKDYGSIIKSGWEVKPSQEQLVDLQKELEQRRLHVAEAQDMTPLQIALFKGHKEVAKELLKEPCCDVNIEDCFGNTPVIIAASRGDVQSISLLKQRGSSLDDRNNVGRSASHLNMEWQIIKERSSAPDCHYSVETRSVSSGYGSACAYPSDGNSAYASCGEEDDADQEPEVGKNDGPSNLASTSNESIAWNRNTDRREKVHRLTQEFLGEAHEKLEKMEKHNNTMSQQDLDETFLVQTAKTLRVDVDRYIVEVSPEKPINVVTPECIRISRDRLHEIDQHFGN